MIDVKHQKCRIDNCKNRARFNFKENSKALFCIEHKKDGMNDVKSRKHKKCIFYQCRKLRIFNFEGSKAEFCNEHKKDGMVDVLSRRCRIDNCKIKPLFNWFVF